MLAISPNMRKTARYRQVSGRPHVSDRIGNERNSPIMAQASVPQQRLPEASCSALGCVSDHRGEAPGQFSHWVDGQGVRTPTAALFADLNVVDGGQPQVVLHASDGERERRLAVPEAVAYATAILAAAAPILSGAVS